MTVIFAFLVWLSAVPAFAWELALVQYDADSHFGDYDTNLKALTGYAEAAVAHGSKLVVFPEGSLYGYSGKNSFWCRPDDLDSRCRDVTEAAEPVPGGRSSRYWEAFARRNQIQVLINLPEVDGGVYYNTTAVFGAKGFEARYRKRSLYVTDQRYASPGNSGAVVISNSAGSFGLLICMDANFPQLYEEYKAQGVSRVIIPMDWDEDPQGRSDARPARTFFQSMAQELGMDLFVSDVSPWDGTGAYLHGSETRSRSGLPAIAIGQNGVSYHSLP